MRETTIRETAEKLALAGVGAVALTAERADALADELARRGGITRDDARRAIDEQRARWRGEASRVGARAGASLQGVFRELGLATGEQISELELRVAQLEHRVRLLEEEPTEPLRPS